MLQNKQCEAAEDVARLAAQRGFSRVPFVPSTP